MERTEPSKKKKQPLTKYEVYARYYAKLKEHPERYEETKGRKRVVTEAFNEARRNDPEKMKELAVRQKEYRMRKKAEKEMALQTQCV
jgi:hypothetical protein